jgi:tRNA A37 threonylcarbamoyladenosine synthetase subunit TsaC/SUA5/YrdC
MAPQMIPAPDQLPNLENDTQAAFKILQNGGTVIGPAGVGYVIMSISAEAVERAFAAKHRREGHTMGVFATLATQRECHDISEDKLAMCAVMTETMGSIFVAVAPYRKDSPRLQALSKETFQKVTKGDTIGMGIIAGDQPFMKRMCELADEAGVLLIGSSANMTGSGNKYRVSDIQPEIIEAVDGVVDHGLQRFYTFAPRASSAIDLRDMSVIRVGADYNLMRDRLWRFFRVELPEDPDIKTEYALEKPAAVLP